jgi:thiamine-phosphate pyrophosphorylase
MSIKDPSFLKLMLITRLGSTPVHTYLNFIHTCIRNGVTSVQLREKDLSFSDLLDFGQALQNLLRPHAIPLIVNDHVDLCLQLDAHGVHLGRSDGNVEAARQKLGDQKIIGSTVDLPEHIQETNRLPIDYIGIGAIFPTNNKTNIEHVWGVDALKRNAHLSKHPMIAIGGIDVENASQVIHAGAYGIAAIGAFHDTEDPKVSTQKLRKCIDDTPHQIHQV